jgi:superoxide dismutase, Fe-Mn family
VVGIVTTHDADLPPVHGRTPLLCCDLWEHAYYLDYHNRRADFVQAFLDHLVNWDFANANMDAAASATNESAPDAMEPNREPVVFLAS